MPMSRIIFRSPEFRLKLSDGRIWGGFGHNEAEITCAAQAVSELTGLTCIIEYRAFLADCDVIRLAKLAGYPMDGGLHRFIELACKDCGWDENEVFRAIFEENPND